MIDNFKHIKCFLGVGHDLSDSQFILLNRILHVLVDRDSGQIQKELILQSWHIICFLPLFGELSEFPEGEYIVMNNVKGEKSCTYAVMHVDGVDEIRKDYFADSIRFRISRPQTLQEILSFAKSRNQND